MKIAICHGSFYAKSGAEFTAIELAKTFNAPIYTMYKTTDFFDSYGVKIIPFRQKEYTNFFLKRIYNFSDDIFGGSFFSQLDLSDYDVIISSGTAAKHIVTNPYQIHIHYLYTPQRHLYDLRHWTLKQVIPGKRTIRNLQMEIERMFDLNANMGVDQFVSISETIAERCHKYYRRTTEVIYPSIDLSNYYSNDSEDYYVTIGSIEPMKRQEMMIKAFNKLGHGYKLKIIGHGEKSYIAMLKSLAEDNIEFLDFVTEKEKIDYLSRCKGLLFSAIDFDYGIPIIEANASGKPVIAVNEGFPKFQIIDGTNGVLHNSNVDQLALAVKRAEEIKWHSETIRQSVIKYNITEINNKWKLLIERLWMDQEANISIGN